MQQGSSEHAKRKNGAREAKTRRARERKREGRCTDLSANTQKGKRAQGAACLGAGETLTGGIMCLSPQNVPLVL